MLIKFSAKRLPEIGEHFVSKITYFPSAPDAIKPGTVLCAVGYAYEHGFLYVLAEPVERTKDAILRGGERRPYVAGADVAAWGPEVVEVPDVSNLERVIENLEARLDAVRGALR